MTGERLSRRVWCSSVVISFCSCLLLTLHCTTSLPGMVIRHRIASSQVPKSVKTHLKFESWEDCKVSGIHEYVTHTHTRTCLQCFQLNLCSPCPVPCHYTFPLHSLFTPRQAPEFKCTFKVHAWVACVYLTRPLASSHLLHPGQMAWSSRLVSDHLSMFVPVAKTFRSCLLFTLHYITSLPGIAIRHLIASSQYRKKK